MRTRVDQGTPGCHGCRHHLITYDAQFPYACQFYGFKSRHSPLREVAAALGLPAGICPEYSARPPRRGPAPASDAGSGSTF